MSTDAMIRLVLNGETMGTRYSVIAHADPGIDPPTLGCRLHAAISDVDSVMSSWKQESDLSRLNHAPVKQWVELPESLMDVLEAALSIEAQSNGAFDIGVGAAVGAWGFGPLAHHPLPELPASRPITRDALELDMKTRRARKQAPLCLDLSGIAKGYGVDRLCEVLTAGGMTRWLVSLDGDVRAGRPKPDGPGRSGSSALRSARATCPA